jgi:hypothetical protein
MGTGGLFLRGKGDYLHLGKKLRLSGTLGLPSLPHTPLWLARRQLHLLAYLAVARTSRRVTFTVQTSVFVLSNSLSYNNNDDDDDDDNDDDNERHFALGESFVPNDATLLYGCMGLYVCAIVIACWTPLVGRQIRNILPCE